MPRTYLVFDDIEGKLDVCFAMPVGTSSPMMATTRGPCSITSSNIQHTVRYTELAPDRFKNFWRD